MKTYLPIGSVVQLKQSEKFLFMIAGYLPKREDSRPFDYFAVPYPTGLANFEQYICFNADSIAEVLFEGYCDEACSKVLKGLDDLTSNIRNYK